MPETYRHAKAAKADILRLLQEKGLKRCVVCGCQTLNMIYGFHLSDRYQDPDDLAQRPYVTAPMVCANCGFVMHFSLDVLYRPQESKPSSERTESEVSDADKS